MDKTALVGLAVAVFMAMSALRGLILWIIWNWFGYACLNLAMPILHAQSIDGWAALGLGIVGTVFTQQATGSSSK